MKNNYLTSKEVLSEMIVVSLDPGLLLLSLKLNIISTQTENSVDFWEGVSKLRLHLLIHLVAPVYEEN